MYSDLFSVYPKCRFASGYKHVSPPKNQFPLQKIACIPKCILSVSQCIPVHRHHLENTHRIHSEYMLDTFFCIQITNPTTFDNKLHHSPPNGRRGWYKVDFCFSFSARPNGQISFRQWESVSRRAPMDHTHVVSTRKNRGFRPLLTTAPPY